MSIKIANILRKPFNVLLIIFLYTVIFGLCVNRPLDIYHGIENIIACRCVLITDYVSVGGVGAALVNAGATGIMLIVLFKLLKLKANGSLIMALWLSVGFSFFGKNMINIWPLIFGGYLYSKYKKEDFLRYSLAAVLSTALAPILTELYYINIFHNVVGNMMFSLVVGVAVGFFMIPLSIGTMKAHSGFNLYNVGFAAGIMGLLIMGILRGIGIKTTSREDFWDTTHTGILSLYVIIICVFLIIIGILLSQDRVKHLKKIYKSSGRLVSDFYLQHKEVAYINMGCLGLFALAYLLIIGGSVNGPTIGGIFTIIGFGAFGKHIKNVLPVMIGATLAGACSIWGLSGHGVILAILFSTALSPICGTFGKIDGIIAGFLHLFIVTNVGYVHGGLNLYNNGFAAGFVAMILVPALTTFRKGDYN